MRFSCYVMCGCFLRAYRSLRFVVCEQHSQLNERSYFSTAKIVWNGNMFHKKLKRKHTKQERKNPKTKRGGTKRKEKKRKRKKEKTSVVHVASSKGHLSTLLVETENLFSAPRNITQHCTRNAVRVQWRQQCFGMVLFTKQSGFAPESAVLERISGVVTLSSCHFAQHNVYLATKCGRTARILGFGHVNCKPQQSHQAWLYTLESKF